MNAPEFPEGLQWLNTDHPLSMEQLRGKVVLLDFWTYCCINCMHIIPDLMRLENEFADELVVIGVHSAKFNQERDSENIRRAIMRYEIRHPVVNDSEFRIWRAYGARAWPTVVLITPDGRIAMSSSGEGVYHRFAQPIRQLVKEFDARGQLDRTPLKLRPESRKPSPSVFNFPGKVAADEAARRLFVSDQNHHRIVVLSLDDYRVLDIIGSGSAGLMDSDFSVARFNHPQGMSAVGDLLFIADTDNHAVRVADLSRRTVETVAGIGRQAGLLAKAGHRDTTPLNSPWDLVAVDSLIFVAMAGSHQIWTIRLSDGWVAPFAGTGQEGLRDGVRTKAWLAQPSGLALSGDRLYFADSEVSAVRFVDLSTIDGRVETILGQDLFEFGDVDGPADKARLQHPLGVAVHNGLVYIADTYNNKIKVLDPENRTVKTIIGDGEPGSRDGKWSRARLYEPGGICVADGKLYIADTNNHLIRVADLSRDEVVTVHIPTASLPPVEPVEELPEQDVIPGAGFINIMVDLPRGTKFTPDSKLVATVVEGGKVIRGSGVTASFPVDSEAPFRLPVEWKSGSGVVVMDINFVYCSGGDDAVCWPGLRKVVLPVRVAPDASESEAQARLTLK